MGLSIGQAPVALVALSGTRNVRSPSFLDKADRPAPRVPSRDDSSDKPVLFSRPKGDAVQIGLGTGISSSPGAALNVVRKTVKEAKALVPTISELENGFRLKASASRAQFQEASLVKPLGNGQSTRPEAPSVFEKSETNRIQVRLPNPSVQARNFINALNETAGAVQAKFSEEDTPQPTTGASFQVNGESFPVRDTSSGFRLNITV